MEQLKMYWKPEKTEFPVLPEGWRWRASDGSEADVAAWVECCRHGLLGPGAGPESFENCISSHEGYSPDSVYFIEHQGEVVATVTALLNEEKEGHVHYVGTKPSVRGIGVGAWLNQIVKADLWKRGCTAAWLTTDEFRVAAVRSYLRAGFLPVDYDVDMQYRWTRMLNFLERTNVPIVNEQGEFVCLLIEYQE